MDTWRLLIHPPSPAEWNMAVDEALADGCRRGLSPPTLRLYGWERPAISLGYFQRADDVVDMAACRGAGIPVVRRTTGGRAVYHDDDITYSMAAPIPHPAFPPSIKGTFAAVARALAAGFANLGVAIDPWSDAAPRRRTGERSPLCFASTSWYEITREGRKIVGSAQRRWKSAFLQHGLILRHGDQTSPFRRLTHPPIEDPVGTIGLDALGRSWSRDEIHAALIAGWEETFRVRLVEGRLSETETNALPPEPASEVATNPSQTNDRGVRSIRFRSDPAHR